MSPLLREMVGSMVLRESNLLQKRFRIISHCVEGVHDISVGSQRGFEILLVSDTELGIFVNIVVGDLNSGVVNSDLGGSTNLLLQEVVCAGKKNILALDQLTSRGAYGN